MTPKYYTPEISEFHIGFEFEYRVKDDIWEKDTIDTSISDRKGLVLDIPSENEYGYDPINIRVKHLDREDIESLGFVYDNSINNRDIFELKIDSHKQIVLKINFNVAKIEILSEDLNVFTDIDNYLFSGKIKNKSELKKLMVQLGIN